MTKDDNQNQLKKFLSSPETELFEGEEDVERSPSKVRRLAKISSAAGGAAIRLVGEKYLGIQADKTTHSQNLKQLLGQLKGPLMKAAQLLSSIPGALPDEYVQELGELQAKAPPMGWPFVRRRMSGELGAAWASLFRSFDRKASAAASLGQVHRAVSLDGEALAVKLQYPDMQHILESDLGHVKLFFSLYETFNRALTTEEVYAELKERLFEEIDYERESKNVCLYQDIFRDFAQIRVPTVHANLSTKRLLTMDWLEGKSLKMLKDWSQERRNMLAKEMFFAWYYPFYQYGVIHGDPHLGNYTFTDAGQINLLDFGCVRFFEGSFIQAVIDLYHALERGKKDQIVNAFEAWGFVNLSNELIEALTQWARFLYAPLLDNSVRTIDAHHGSASGHDMAMQVHQKLNQSGGICPPREFVLMDRAAVGMGAVFMHLGAEANWYQLFHTLIEGFNPVQMAERQGHARKKSGF